MSLTPPLSELGRRSAEPRATGATSPAALRSTPSRWRDPRLWLGALLVLASVAAGARLLSAADDTVAVWQLEHDVAAGLPITVDDLKTTQVHFDDADAAAAYLAAAEPPPTGARLARAVGAGELLVRSSLSTEAPDAPGELPVGVAGENLPADLAMGDRVAVWALPEPGPPGRTPVLVLNDVLVLSVGAVGAAGGGSDRAVLLELGEEAVVADVLAGLNGSTVVLVRTGP